MRTKTRMALRIAGAGAAAAAIAAAGATAATGATAANAATIDPGGPFVATATQMSMPFLPNSAPPLDDRCDVRLTGTLATSGDVGSTVGKITGGSTRNCNTGAITFLGFPWKLRLTGFVGGKPRLAIEHATAANGCTFHGDVPLTLDDRSTLVVGPNQWQPFGTCDATMAWATGSALTITPAQRIRP